VEDEVFEDTRACDVHVEAELPEDDVNPIVLAEMQTRDVLAEMLSILENQVVGNGLIWLYEYHFYASHIV